MKIIFLLFLTFVKLFATEQVAKEIQAQYKVWTSMQTSYINYYKKDNYVAYEYISQGITEVWKKMPNDKVALTRGFDVHKRSIEYDAIDLKMEHANSSWKAHQNIVNPEELDYDLCETLLKDEKNIAHYIKRDEREQMDIYWDIDKDILISYTIKNDYEYKLIYELVSMDHRKNSHVKQVLAYDTTDFSDIGDNESDSFFRRMINLGFISHHEANIIDANGNALALRNKH